MVRGRGLFPVRTEKIQDQAELALSGILCPAVEGLGGP
jgi:hypothetical protein